MDAILKETEKWMGDGLYAMALETLSLGMEKLREENSTVAVINIIHRISTFCNGELMNGSPDAERQGYLLRCNSRCWELLLEFVGQ